MDVRRHILKKIYDTAIGAVAPDTALLRHVSLEGEHHRLLTVAGQSWDLSRHRVRVVGAGKAAAPMAVALESLLGRQVEEGCIVVKYDHGLPLRHIEEREAGHPVPDEAGVAATRRMLEIAGHCSSGDLLICLFTGGTSALTPAPAAGLTLADMQHTTRLMLECGATIAELNAVRKHLSSFSGGQLARSAAPAEILSLIVSDVVGDPLDVIASGPTAPDASSFAFCRDILGRYGLENKVAEAVRHRLLAGCHGELSETPKEGDPLFRHVHNVVVASNRQALDAAAREAERCGYTPCVLTDHMTGEARCKAVELVAEARKRAKARSGFSKGVCLLAGGETTVTIRGNGKGGRNQEMALAAALELQGEDRICGLFAGTDGTDGPTDAAGGFVFSDTVLRMGGEEEARHRLEDNDSFHALQRSDDLLLTGPTRTNVMDLAMLLVDNDEIKI